jgi:8-oxo-dGTP pyrophosphatase MutT (NUDIX family)
MVDSVLYQTAWLDVYDRDGYIFTHTHNDVVYLLPFRFHVDVRLLLLARFEICPAHSLVHELTSITGQCPAGHEPLEIAVKELYEEGGYRAKQDQFIYLKSVRPVKFADTTAHLYAIDVTGMEQEPAPGDGTTFEQSATTYWMALSDMADMVCPVFVAMLALLARQDHQVALRWINM